MDGKKGEKHKEVVSIRNQKLLERQNSRSREGDLLTYCGREGGRGGRKFANEVGIKEVGPTRQINNFLTF